MVHLKDFGFDEIDENQTNWTDTAKIKVDFPKPGVKYRLVLENFNRKLEENYFWVLNAQTRDGTFPMQEAIKVTDTYFTSVKHNLFGEMGGKATAQQNQLSQLGRTISELIQGGMFQMIRELREIDEKLIHYQDGGSDAKNALLSNAAEVTLKDRWTALVERGAENPGSVWGLAQKLQYQLLPDLFFKTHCKDKDDVDEVVDKLEGLNERYKYVLKRKLREFYSWRDLSYRELTTRRGFDIKYLRQLYNTVNMYLQWMKPYLDNIKRLNQKESLGDNAEIIGAFDTMAAEIELITRSKFKSADISGVISKLESDYEKKMYDADQKHTSKLDELKGRKVSKFKIEAEEKKRSKELLKIQKELERKKEEETKKSTVYSCVSSHFLFITKPPIENQQQGYGYQQQLNNKVELTVRSYAWTEWEFEQYKKYRDRQVHDLLGEINSSLKDLMDSIWEDLEYYLEEAEEKNLADFAPQKQEFTGKVTKPKDVEKPKLPGIMDPFLSVAQGFGEIVFPNFDFKFSPKKQSGPDLKNQIKDLKGKALGDAGNVAWSTNNYFKKAHQMLTW